MGWVGLGLGLAVVGFVDSEGDVDGDGSSTLVHRVKTKESMISVKVSNEETLMYKLGTLAMDLRSTSFTASPSPIVAITYFSSYRRGAT